MSARTSALTVWCLGFLPKGEMPLTSLLPTTEIHVSGFDGCESMLLTMVVQNQHFLLKLSNPQVMIVLPELTPQVFEVR